LVLLAEEGASDQAIANRLGLSLSTVYRWRSRFATERLAGLEERPRRGRPRRYTEAARARVISAVCTEAPPDGATQWTVRSLARHTGVGRDAVHRILRAERLAPHRVKSWVTSTDPEFETKALDILGLYLNPPENALVLSVDEKTAIQALDRTQPTLPLRPGQVERRSFEYKRNGTTSLYAALVVHQGEVVGQCAPRHRHQEFLAFLRLLVRTFPGRQLHLIVDNLSAHKHENVHRWLRRHPRIDLHFTPTHASWLNQVEIWFSILSRKVIRRGVFPSVKALTQAIMAFIERYNQQGKSFTWTFTPERLEAIVINRTKH
jgi:transposase